jgi:hypothetical protein
VLTGRAPAAPPSKPKQHVKPPLPPKDEVPTMGLVSAKNFVLANAVETMLAPARKPPPPPPPATAKADFGKVPSYLGGVKARLAAEKAAEEERKLEEVRIVHRRAAREARLAPAALRHGSGLIHPSIRPHRLVLAPTIRSLRARRLRRRRLPAGCASCRQRSARSCWSAWAQSGRR